MINQPVIKKMVMNQSRAILARSYSSSENFDYTISRANRVPKIVNEIKLDFKDVLIRPQLSTLSSRSGVDLERDFKFKHSDTKWKGIPIMSANMDTTGTFEIAVEFSKHNMITCLHKHYTVEETVTWGK